MSSHAEVDTLLGAYALDALDAAEVAAVEAHLLTCAACRAEFAALSGVTSRLAALTPEEALDRWQPSDETSAAVVAAVLADRRREARRTSWIQKATAAAAAVVVLAAGVTAAVSLDEPAGPTLEAVSVSAAGGVTASADLIDHTWGVEIVLAGAGFAPGAYAVEVQRREGAPVMAGAFVGVGAKPLLCNLTAAVLRADATGFTVRDASGQAVVTAVL